MYQSIHIGDNCTMCFPHEREELYVFFYCLATTELFLSLKINYYHALPALTMVTVARTLVTCLPRRSCLIPCRWHHCQLKMGGTGAALGRIIPCRRHSSGLKRGCVAHVHVKGQHPVLDTHVLQDSDHLLEHQLPPHKPHPHVLEVEGVP